MRKRYLLVAVLVLIIQIASSAMTSYAQTTTRRTKEVNLVFLHGAGGSSCSMQLLSDIVMDKMPAYIDAYQEKNPDVSIRVDTLNRCYPNTVDIDTWANNIADSIKQHFHQNNLILIGHSTGGKAALYMTAHNTGNLSDNIAAVITIDSPVKDLSRYYFTGGVNFWAAQFLIPLSAGVVNSLAYYDSSADGLWVGTHKHWLALCAAESSPMSSQFDTNGIDPLPRNMDDEIVPISAQYASGADVVYYGEHSHREFTTDKAVAGKIADDILRYIFGDDLDFSVLSGSGTFGHKAGNFPVLYKWNETTGEVPAGSGSFSIKNATFWKWENWDFVVGETGFKGERSSYSVKARSLPLISGLTGVKWLDANKDDARLVISIRAAPFTSVRITWSINGYIPGNTERDRYEVAISTGTPYTEVSEVNWASPESDDFRLQIKSQAEGPLRWFTAGWKTYAKQTGSRKIIDKMPFLFESTGPPNY